MKVTIFIHVISNGIDLNKYQKDEQAGKDFRHKYRYSDTDKIIMSAGLIIKRKGILDFIELAKRMPEYKFIWFGTADLHLVGKEVRKVISEKSPNLTFAGYDIPVYTDWLKNGKDVYKAKEINDFEKIAKSILKYELPDLTEQGYETVQQKNIYHIGKQLSYVYNKESKNVSQL